GAGYRQGAHRQIPGMTRRLAEAAYFHSPPHEEHKTDNSVCTTTVVADSPEAATARLVAGRKVKLMVPCPMASASCSVPPSRSKTPSPESSSMDEPTPQTLPCCGIAMVDFLMDSKPTPFHGKHDPPAPFSAPSLKSIRICSLILPS